MRVLKSLIFIFSVSIICSTVGQASPNLGYNLVDNLPNAHIYELVIADLRQISAFKYLRDARRRWVYDYTFKGRKAALPQSIRADFWLPITTELAKQELAGCSSGANCPKQVMDVFVGGKKIKNVNFTDSNWQSVRVKIPAKAVNSASLVKVKLHFRRRHEIKNGEVSAAIRAIRLGLLSASAFASRRRQTIRGLNRPLHKSLI